jgi:hypothetical protein
VALGQGGATQPAVAGASDWSDRDLSPITQNDSTTEETFEGRDHFEGSCVFAFTGKTAWLGRTGPQHAPNPALAAALLGRLTQLHASVVAARTLVAYVEELEGIALSDACALLRTYRDLILANTRTDPSLAAHYTALLERFQAVGEAIPSGRRRTRAARAGNGKGSGATGGSGTAWPERRRPAPPQPARRPFFLWPPARTRTAEHCRAGCSGLAHARRHPRRPAAGSSSARSDPA